MKTFSSLARPQILVVSLAGIGNFLMASPLFRALKDAHPAAEIDVLLAPRGTDAVASGNPRIRRVLQASPKPSLRDWRHTVAEIRRARYDVGLVTHPGQLITSASLLFFGGVRRRIGHRYAWGGLRDIPLFLTDGIPLRDHTVLPLDDRSAHDVVQNLELLRPLGRSPRAEEATYDFPLAADDAETAAAWWATHRLGHARTMGIHPGAHADLTVKRWPPDRWAFLADRVAENLDAVPLVFGGPEERPLAVDVCQRMRRRAIPVTEPLRATAALIARCVCFLSNDSGLMHVAASQNVPTFGLFGPTDERRTAPWGACGYVVRAPGTRPTYDVARLRSAGARSAPDPSLLALTPEDAAREILALVSASA